MWSESGPSDTRVATSPVGSHELGVSRGEAIVDPAMHLHTPPSHSAASQQAVVSVSTGNYHNGYRHLIWRCPVLEPDNIFPRSQFLSMHES